MKSHLLVTNSKIRTVCGGRVSGFAQTGKKQFYAVDEAEFLSTEPKWKCVKCQAAYEAKQKPKP